MIDVLTRELASLDLQGRFSGVVHLQAGPVSVYSAAFGWAHRAWKVPNRLDTRFRAASLGKMFTAVAVLQHLEAGALSLETPVVDVLDLAGSRIPDEVTIYHLLTMTSGIADWFDEAGGTEAWEAFLLDQPLQLLRENRDYLPLFLGLEPVSSPGEKYHYNGAGYILLGLVVEACSGLSYERYVREQVFNRAGMRRSGFPALDDVASDVAEGYHPKEVSAGGETAWQRNVYRTTPGPAADGGATTCAADLVRFSHALRGGELLGGPMTQAMLKPAVTQLPEEFRGYRWRYGFGLSFLLDQEDQVVRYGHTGEEDGVSCRFYHYPNWALDVILLGNQTGVAGPLGWEIHDLVMSAGLKS